MLGEGRVRVEALVQLGASEGFHLDPVFAVVRVDRALLRPVQPSRVAHVVNLAMGDARLRDAALRALGKDQRVGQAVAEVGAAEVVPREGATQAAVDG